MQSGDLIVEKIGPAHDAGTEQQAHPQHEAVRDGEDRLLRCGFGLAVHGQRRRCVVLAVQAFSPSKTRSVERKSIRASAWRETGKEGCALGIDLVGSLRIPPAFGDSRDGAGVDHDRRCGAAKGSANTLRIRPIHRLELNPEEPARGEPLHATVGIRSLAICGRK